MNHGFDFKEEIDWAYLRTAGKFELLKNHAGCIQNQSDSALADYKLNLKTAFKYNTV